MGWENTIIHGVETRRLMSDADANEYRRLVEQLPDESLILEVGVFDGGSLLSIADLIKSKHLQVLVADPFTQPMTADFNKRGQMLGSRESFMDNMKDAQINLLSVLDTSADLVEWLKVNHREFDFVFIDADHGYEGVTRDILKLWPFLKSGGTMSGHDFYDEHPGVKKAVGENFDETGFHVAPDTGVWSVRK